MCPTEITAFSDRIQEFKDINCEVLAASVDSEFTHLAFQSTPRSKGGLGSGIKLPLLADVNKKMAKAYGVLLEDAGVSLRYYNQQQVK